MRWKPVEGTFLNPHEHTVTLKIRDVASGDEQTIVTTHTHPFFAAASADVVHLAATGTDGLPPPSSEGHIYTGLIANGHWIDAEHLKPGYRLLGVATDVAASDNSSTGQAGIFGGNHLTPAVGTPANDNARATGWVEVVEFRVERTPLEANNLSVADWHTYFVRGAANDNDA